MSHTPRKGILHHRLITNAPQKNVLLLQCRADTVKRFCMKTVNICLMQDWMGTEL
jgi:hypothetical protein